MSPDLSLLGSFSAPQWLMALLRTMGYDFSQIPADADVELLWANFPTSWGVFVLLAIVAAVLYGVFWVYRRELDTCSMRMKYLLGIVRSVVLGLLLFIFLGPALVAVQRKPLQPEIVLLRDGSLSMATADRYSDDGQAAQVAEVLGKTTDEVRTQRPNRGDIINQLFSNSDHKLVKQMLAKGRLRAYDFAEGAEKIDQRSNEPNSDGEKKPPATTAVKEATFTALPPVKTTGRTTDLTQAIRTGLTGEAPAAIVVITDGQHTGRDDPRDAAREAKERGVPLMIVGVGDSGRPKNLKVGSVYVRPQVWQDEPFEVDAMILAQGSEARTVRVDLIEQRVNESDGTTSSGVAVQTLQLNVPENGGRLRAEFSHTARESGKFVYNVKVETIDDELAEDDNQLPSQPVKVLSREKVRVLLVAGAPTWDFRLVQKLLQRDKTITVACWLQTLDEDRAQEGSKVITHLPNSKEELFWYDVVLLFDPNPQEFDQAWIELLKQFAGEHAGGVLFMAGPKHAGTFLTSARTGAMRDILPVRFGDVAELELKNLLTTNQRAWPMRMVAANADHPMLMFYPDRQETLKRWDTLPGIFWSFPAQEPKPTSMVLAEHGDPTLRTVEAARPMLVSGRYGAGHTIYIGFNGTWRWRKAGRQAEFFDKFWIQTVRYLVEGRSLEGRRRGYLQTDRDRYEVGERITLTARLQDASYNPLSAPKIDSILQTTDGTEPVVLLPAANRPGTFEATVKARKPGLQTLRLTLPAGPDGESPQIESQFTVELPSVETSEVWLDKPLLADLASISGGKYFDINEVGLLAAAIPDKTQIHEIRSKPLPLWDVSGMLVALVGLLGVEWWIRKQCKLM